MKRILPLLLITVFTGIAILSPVLFDMNLGHAGGCIASAIDGNNCPTNIADFGTHHLSALATFTRAITPDAANWLLAFTLLLLASVFMFLFLKDLFTSRSQFLPQRLRKFELDSSYGQRKIISWLSLFELSPAIV